VNPTTPASVSPDISSRLKDGRRFACSTLRLDEPLFFLSDGAQKSASSSQQARLKRIAAAADQRHNHHDDEDDEEDAGDLKRDEGGAVSAEKCRKQRKHGEHQSPSQ